MCGRYVAALDFDALVEEFEITRLPAERLAADYNVAPTKRVYLIAEESVADQLGNALEIARWGLIPSWSKDRSRAARMINARVETIGEKPSFRDAFARRRCLIPASGYYEWSGPQKQPYYIHAANDAPLAMAGLYEWWLDKSVDESGPGAWTMTCSIITAAASSDLTQIHERMPIMIARGDRAGWLATARDGQEALAGLRTPVPLAAHRVSIAVNKVSNFGSALIAGVVE
ncbi:MAG: SOS response-associated peptidase [Actinomycetota bacterium]|nr:SOS response-associated peptidase [Actinomycetota bacterium]